MPHMHNIVTGENTNELLNVHNVGAPASTVNKRNCCNYSSEGKRIQGGINYRMCSRIVRIGPSPIFKSRLSAREHCVKPN